MTDQMHCRVLQIVCTPANRVVVLSRRPQTLTDEILVRETIIRISYTNNSPLFPLSASFARLLFHHTYISGMGMDSNATPALGAPPRPHERDNVN